MKDGYYLSTYLHINELCYMIDINVSKKPSNNNRRHNQNISLWCKSGNDVKLMRFWELERLTGNKQHNIPFKDIEHAKQFINFLLKEFDLNIDDMEEIWGTPGLDTSNDYHSITDYPNLAYHNIAHLFSSILMDSDKFYNSNIVGISVDTRPDRIHQKDSFDKSFYSGCVVRHGNVEIFPIFSPGPMWAYAKQWYGMREGTLMALESACNSRAYFDLDKLLLIDDLESFNNSQKNLSELYKKINNITTKDTGVLFNGYDERFSELDNKASMFIKILHQASIKIMEKNINDIISKYSITTQDTYLSLSGGYALNCPTNTYLMNKYNFKGFITPPCVNDCGLSLGIALYAFYKRMKFLNFKLEHAYYGTEDYSLDESVSAHDEFVESITDFETEQIIDDLKDGPIVWFEGAAEIGPRALGHRSVLADPRYEWTKDMLNKIKQRQWWRPVAPIVLEEDVSEWFECAGCSPFMLHAYAIKNEKLEFVPAISHLDGTSRIQTINRDMNPMLYDVIKAFKQKTGIPILCNTSLNDLGEPIINSINEAFNFVLRKGLLVAYINGKRVKFINHDKFKPIKPSNRVVNFSCLNDKLYFEKANPYGIDNSILDSYTHDTILMDWISLLDKDEVLLLEKVVELKKLAYEFDDRLSDAMNQILTNGIPVQKNISYIKNGQYRVIINNIETAQTLVDELQCIKATINKKEG